jgi:hypothetical protein
VGFWDTLLGRTKPVTPDLDELFGLPSAAITLEAALDFTPTGDGAVCFASTEGEAFHQTIHDARSLLSAGFPTEFRRDDYGYSWLILHRPPEEITTLVNDLHAINTELEANGFGPQLLCSLVAFTDPTGRALALVYLYKRGTFYPFAPLPNNKRNNPLELEIKTTLKDDLRIEPDLTRWFPVWSAPGM